MNPLKGGGEAKERIWKVEDSRGKRRRRKGSCSSLVISFPFPSPPNMCRSKKKNWDSHGERERQRLKGTWDVFFVSCFLNAFLEMNGGLARPNRAIFEYKMFFKCKSRARSSYLLSRFPNCFPWVVPACVHDKYRTGWKKIPLYFFVFFLVHKNLLFSSCFACLTPS